MDKLNYTHMLPDNTNSEGSQLPLRPALSTDKEGSPRIGSPESPVKAVQIHEPEPTPTNASGASPPSPRRRFSAHVGLSRRLSGKLSSHSTPALLRHTIHTSPDPSTPMAAPDVSATRTESQDQSQLGNGHGHAPASTPTSPHHHDSHQAQRYYHHRLLSQVAGWLSSERRKMESRGKKRRSPRRRKSKSPPSEAHAMGRDEASATTGRMRSDSIDSQSSEVSLERLQRILDTSVASMGLASISDLSLSTPKFLRRSSSRKRLMRPSHKTASSDTEYHDGDVVVPSCDAILDNSRTLAYSGGGGAAAAASTDDLTSHKEQKKSRHAWLLFKNEIIRLAHTLHLKGWRRVPLTAGNSVTVQRLSGALTNAVYVVSPPEGIVRTREPGKRSPPKLLLRIYGPNVEALIDRENELSVLRRLARKKIGPRLLGTFTNGRFEQFFNSTTLTAANLREPDTSRLIAKRMRELHDGIALLPEERYAGSSIWNNWERWLDSVETRVKFLDSKVRDGAAGSRGYVCGVEWEKFRAMVEKYRIYLNGLYRDQAHVRERLVFAHNDTQYGNILRIRPDDEASPLIQPENQHKQLVVIDFEYAGPNTIGYEFANHFTEWTYNYHDATAPHRCNTAAYPTLDEQRRFARAYVEHGTKGGSSGTPRLGPPEWSANKITEFMLDARAPPGGWTEAERLSQQEACEQVEALLEETRAWRPGCSAVWIAWGIVQAEIDGVPGEERAGIGREESDDDRVGGVEDGDVVNTGTDAQVGASTAMGGEEEGGEEFDYLGYAKERAMFFWGDCVLLGLASEEELPENVRKELKKVEG